MNKFWPEKEQLDRCFNTVAEANSMGFLLAVHQPMNFKRKIIGNSGEVKSGDEYDLLNYFLDDNIPNGNLIVPIKGGSGLGKSHIIRWLEAQISRKKEVGRRIIRIPKHTSLKEVIKQILRGLDDERYRTIQDQVENAMDTLKPDDAADKFKMYLTTALREKAESAMNNIREAMANGQTPDEEDERISWHCSEDGLQALINDIEYFKLFKKGSIKKLLNKSICGKADDENDNGKGEKEEGPAFVEEDLQFEGMNFDAAATRATSYYGALSYDDGKERRRAAGYLCDVVDAALGKTIKKEESFSFVQIFKNVRRELLHDKVELILLIEDFATLAGIQGDLLDVITTEAKQNDVQELCNMRTAIAYTEGYFTQKETVLTRANTEWIIEETPYVDDSICLQKITDFIGSYLNAARFGADKINKMYAEASANTEPFKIGNFIDEEENDAESLDLIQKFGKSKGGYHLFPFNENAIRELAFHYLKTESGKLKFNPRFIINNILREILIEFREEFMNKEFPSSRFPQSTSLDLQIKETIRQAVSPGISAERYFNLYRYWGGKPETEKDLKKLPENIYKAFALEPLFASEGQNEPGEEQKDKEQKDKEQKDKEQKDKEQKDKEEDDDSDAKKVKEYNRKIQNWVDGEFLDSDSANLLRKTILDGIKHFINWNKELINPKSPIKVSRGDLFSHENIFIARARNNPQNKGNSTIIAVSDDEYTSNKDETGLNLKAVFKYSIYKENWREKMTEHEIARYTAFVQKFEKPLVSYIRKHFWSSEENFVRVLSQTAYLQGKIIGLERGSAGDDFAAGEKKEVLKMIFGKCDDIQFNGNHISPAWQQLRENCIYNRENILKYLYNQVSAFQGETSDPKAVDPVAVLESFDEEFIHSCKIKKIATSQNQIASSKFIFEHIDNINYSLVPAVREYSAELIKIKKEITTLIGEEPDLTALCRSLSDTYENIKLNNAYFNPPSDIKRSLEELEKVPLLAELKKIKRLEENEFISGKTKVGPGGALDVLSKIDVHILIGSLAVLKAFEAFICQAIKLMNQKASEISDEIVGQIIKSIRESLGSIEISIKKIKGE